MNKRQLLESFLSEFGFLKEETDRTLEVYDIIAENKEAIELFDSVYIPYRDEHRLDYDDFLKKAAAITEMCGLRQHEANNPLAMILATASQWFYTQKGISYQIWKDSFTDLKWKTRECKQVYGYYGTRAISWYRKWYYAERVTLGRLQFELVESTINYKSDRFDVKVGDKYVNLHIPADTEKKFNKENCHQAYRLAGEFFKKDFDGKKPILHCATWLLFPEHKNILPERSNIRRFLDDFELVPGATRESNDNLWRIFYITDPSVKVEDYPEDTEVQRCYKKFILSGGKPGWSRGFVKVDY